MAEIYMTPLSVENKREHYFDPREQSKQMHERKLLASRPVKAWGHKLISFVGYAFIIGAAVVCLAVKL